MKTDIVIRIAGTAGEGALSLGDILGQAFGKLGWEMLLSFNFDPEVRGEKPSFSQVRVSDEKVLSQGEEVDVLLAMNGDVLALNIADLAPHGVVVYDGRPIDLFHGEQEFNPALPEGAKGVPVPLDLISESELGFPAAKNMAALGALTRLLGLPQPLMHTLVESRFKRKDERTLTANLKALDIGFERVGAEPLYSFGERGAPSLVLSGNRASGLGAMAGGLRFYAGYPITPATEVMEQLARDLPSLGGTVVQAEDEISAIGMTLGASFAGLRSMTATSGPGLSLMTELLGLSAMAEVPCVVLDVQRGGPSTGLPTRPEQSDLNLAMTGGHGDTSRMVMAPTNVEECFYAVGRALGLAEKYQAPVIVLTDQYIAYRRETVEALDPSAAMLEAATSPTDEELKDYRRYRITRDGVSPMARPGLEGGYFTATGLEHDEYGRPAYDAATHQAMSDKRARKLDSAMDEKWFHRFGPEDAEVGVITWGGSVGAAREAAQMACDAGVKTAMFYSVFINPLPEDEIREFIKGMRRIIAPEMNHAGQFARILRERFLVEVEPLSVVEGRPISARMIYRKIAGGSSHM